VGEGREVKGKEGKWREGEGEGRGWPAHFWDASSAYALTPSGNLTQPWPVAITFLHRFRDIIDYLPKFKEIT